ncbi:hypothetical protein pb186bvf_004174 [Paramecium bursaria]
MNQPILVQLIYIDSNYENIDRNQVYKCLGSNSITIEEIYVMDLPHKVLVKKSMPIIVIHNYRYSNRLQNKLFVHSYKIIDSNVRGIIGNPKHNTNENPNNPSVLSEPKNDTLMRSIEQKKKARIQKPPQVQISIKNLKLESQNYFFIAKVLDNSGLKYCQNEVWQGDYFFLQVLDQEHSQIRITFFEKHCHNFLNAFQVGEVYEFHNFQVKFRTYNNDNCQHEFNLNCQDNSSIKKSSVVIDQQYLTIEQIKIQQVGNLINIIAFVQVECNKLLNYGIKKLEKRSLALKDGTGSIQLNIWNPQEHKLFLLGQVIMAFKNVRLCQYKKEIQLNSTPSSQFIQSQQQLIKENAFIQLKQIMRNPDFLNFQGNRNTFFCLQRALGKEMNQYGYTNEEFDDDDESLDNMFNVKVERWDIRSGKSIPINSIERKHYSDSIQLTDDTPPKSPNRGFGWPRHR